MARMDARIGTPDRRPDVTISGRPYTLPASTRGLNYPGYYVVMDVLKSRDFDVEAEIAALNAQLSPPVYKEASDDEPEA